MTDWIVKEWDLNRPRYNLFHKPCQRYLESRYTKVCRKCKMVAPDEIITQLLLLEPWWGDTDPIGKITLPLGGIRIPLGSIKINE